MATQAQLKDTASIPSEELEDWGPVPVPIGERISRLRGRTLCSNADSSEAGVWEIVETTRKTYLTYKGI